MQKPLEMQIFTVSAIKALGIRKSRPFLYLPIVEKTRFHLQKYHGESEVCIIEKSVLLTFLRNDFRRRYDMLEASVILSLCGARQ